METVPAAAARDRLSNLPDCLLHSVLSSLRSRQTVQTCLLSRRWRHLWRSVPCLDVDQRDFLFSDADNNKARKEREIKRRRRSFEDFADAVLLLHGVWPIDAFRLHIADQDLRTELQRWMRRGLARHPAELHIAYDNSGHPHEDLLFSMDFASGGAGALSVTTRLRTLHLSGLTLSKKFADELISECPVLEDLSNSIVDCEYAYNVRGRIASSSLKKLHVEGSISGYNSSWLCALAAPNLVSLNLDKVCLPDIEDELQSLAVASISYPYAYYGCDYFYSRFLISMRNARVLKLRDFTTVGLLEEEPKNFCEFHNLRTLILTECDIGKRCKVVSYILENVSNLERLVLQDCKISPFDHSWESASSWCGPTFHGCKNLKSIQVKYKCDDVPHVLVDVLTQIANDVVKTYHGKSNNVGWLEWMHRVTGWQERFITQHSAVAESNSSLSDEEHESNVWKHHARKKHYRDCAVKAHRT